MSEEEEEGFDENPGVGSLEPEDVQPDKNHLLHELFGEGSESEESGENTRGPQNSLKRGAPLPSEPVVTKNKGAPERAQKRQKREVDSPPEEEEDNPDDIEESALPNFTSSLDNRNDDLAIEEEQEIRLDEMPYEKPPEDCPLHYFKLSGLGIEPKPFDEETFKEETEEGEKKVKKKSGPTVRWRFSLDKNQALIKESNARFVRWSDGSMHLVVGKDYYGVQSQEFKDYHHLFIKQRKDHNAEAFLQCHGILEKKLVLILTDNTQIKKETLQKLKNLKSLESSGIRRQFAISTNDPEKEKKVKEILEDTKTDLRKQYGREHMNQELTRDFLEGDMEEDEETEKARETRIMAAKVANLKDVRNPSYLQSRRRENPEEEGSDSG